MRVPVFTDGCEYLLFAVVLIVSDKNAAESDNMFEKLSETKPKAIIEQISDRDQLKSDKFSEK